jgi:hypothetical protein
MTAQRFSLIQKCFEKIVKLGTVTQFSRKILVETMKFRLNILTLTNNADSATKLHPEIETVLHSIISF